MEASHRSIHPNIPGVPWWTALLIAVTATAVGYGIDAGHKELTHVFAGCYIAGCVAAVLAVRQDGLFTAIIQPPLILFCAVPGAYYLFHGGKIGHLKDLLINCGYPLIERFPLMLGTAGAVLLIGLVRWYFGMSQRAVSAGGAADDAAESPAPHSLFGGIAAKLHSILRPETPEEAAAATRRGRNTGTADTGAKDRRTTRTNRSTAGATRTRSRRARPPLDDVQDERSRRPSPRVPAAARDYDEPPRRSRRRPRPQADPDPRDQPREARREPRPRRSPHERSAARGGRFGGYDMSDPPGAPGRYSPYEPDDRYDLYDPAYEPKRRRAASPSHHPISQVRYRGAAAGDPTRADPRGQYRPRSRANGNGRSQGRPPAESWEYDR